MTEPDLTETEARDVARALFAADDTPEADVRATAGALFGGPTASTADDAHDDAEPAPRNLFA